MARVGYTTGSLGFNSEASFLGEGGGGGERHCLPLCTPSKHPLRHCTVSLDTSMRQADARLCVPRNARRKAAISVCPMHHPHVAVRGPSPGSEERLGRVGERVRSGYGRLLTPLAGAARLGKGRERLGSAPSPNERDPTPLNHAWHGEH